MAKKTFIHRHVDETCFQIVGEGRHVPEREVKGVDEDGSYSYTECAYTEMKLKCRSCGKRLTIRGRDRFRNKPVRGHISAYGHWLWERAKAAGKTRCKSDESYANQCKRLFNQPDKTLLVARKDFNVNAVVQFFGSYPIRPTEMPGPIDIDCNNILATNMEKLGIGDPIRQAWLIIKPMSRGKKWGLRKGLRHKNDPSFTSWCNELRKQLRNFSVDRIWRG